MEEVRSKETVLGLAGLGSPRILSCNKSVRSNYLCYIACRLLKCRLPAIGWCVLQCTAHERENAVVALLCLFVDNSMSCHTSGIIV